MAIYNKMSALSKLDFLDSVKKGKDFPSPWTIFTLLVELVESVKKEACRVLQHLAKVRDSLTKLINNLKRLNLDTIKELKLY